MSLSNKKILSHHALALAAALALSAAGLRAAELDVPNGTTDLAALGSTSTSDLTFTNLTYVPNTIGVTANLAAATINDLDATQTITVNNPTASTTVALTLAGGSNAVAAANGGNAADLFYVASGGNLNLVGTGSGLGTIGGITFNAGGNLDVNGTLNLGPVLTWNANTLTKTGTGTLILNAANVGTGGLNINSGTVSAAGSINTTLGSANSTVTLGSGAANATLNFTSTPSGVAQNFVVAAGSGVRTLSASNSVSSGNGVVFSSTNTITLSNNLIVSETGTNAGNVQFRGVINESGGSYGVTVNNTAQTTSVQFRAANTFSGGVTIAGGTALFNTTSSAGSVGAITSGPFGTGTITLGAGSAAASLVSDNNQSILNNITVATGGTRTIGQTGAGTTAATVSGPVTINGDLTLTAVATTLTTGANRLRIGAGGLSGGGNLIIDNANTAVGAAVNSGAVRLDGAASATAWTGNVIVKNGQLSLQSNNALGPANAVGISSTGLFNYSEAILNPVIAGLSNATAAGALGGTTGGVVQASVASSRRLTLAGTGNYAFAGTIINNTNGTDTAGLNVNLTAPAASQTLSGASTYTGVTSLTGGTLSVGTLANGGVASNIGASTNAAANLVLQGGTLQYTGPAVSTDRSFTINAPGGTIDASGTGALALANTAAVSVADIPAGNYTTTAGSTNVTISSNSPIGNAYPLVVGTPVSGTNVPAGTTVATVNIANNTFTLSQAATGSSTSLLTFGTVNRTLTLTGTSAAANTIAGVLGNTAGGATLGVTKTGTGTWNLTGANTYTGATTITGGTLKIANATAISNVLSATGGGVTLGTTGGRLLLDYTGGTSPAATVAGLLAPRYNATSPGSSANFTTGTVRSSAALPGGRTIGYGDTGTGAASTIPGYAVNTVVVRVTLEGDTDLDGDVDFNDFLTLQNFYNQTATRFDQGNFNYDNVTDFNDFLALQNNYGQSIGFDGAAPKAVLVTAEQIAALDAFAAANAPVPEPASLAVLGLGAAGLLRRRRV